MVVARFGRGAESISSTSPKVGNKSSPSALIARRSEQRRHLGKCSLARSTSVVVVAREYSLGAQIEAVQRSHLRVVAHKEFMPIAERKAKRAIVILIVAGTYKAGANLGTLFYCRQGSLVRDFRTTATPRQECKLYGIGAYLLLCAVERMTDVRALEEYTLESGRPDTITEEKLAVAREYGVGRISVNPQTLCDDVLRNIGRAHDTEMFYRAYEIARKSGIPVINTDLIAGLPGDNFKTFSASFDGIMALRPENVTVHTFCVKKSAELRHAGSDIYSMRGGDTGKCVDYSQIKCAHEGYIPYYMYRQKNTVGNFENVGFALPGYEGLYNIYMMEEVHSIFAAGAGAVTKLVDYAPVDGTPRFIERLFNPKYPFEYLDEAAASANREKLARAESFYRERSMLD